MSNYIAVIGDLVNSKKIPNRAVVQQQLEAILQEINETEHYRSSLRSKFTITLGDEFQGLLLNPAYLFEILIKIELALHPQEIRFGVGIGPILTDIGDYSIGADGPAFWQARAAIERIHEENDFAYANIYIMRDAYEKSSAMSNEAKSIETASLDVMNDLLAFRSFTQKKWTTAQTDVVRALLEADAFDADFVRKDIALAMDLSASALVKRVKAGGIQAYLRSAKHLEALLLSLM